MEKEGTQKQKKVTIQGDELYVALRSPEDAKGRSHKVRVVQWTVDGTKQAPKLEKRGFFKGAKSGDVMTGDLEAFTLQDVRTLSQHLPKILQAMEGHAN